MASERISDQRMKNADEDSGGNSSTDENRKTCAGLSLETFRCYWQTCHRSWMISYVKYMI